jgi:hypothetical protein
VFIIDGLKNGQVGLYTKVHHAGIDGQAGVAVAKAIFDWRPPAGSSSRPRRARATTATSWASRSWPAPPPATRCGNTPS